MKSFLISILMLICSLCASASDIEAKMSRMGLVDIHSLDPDIAVCLKYATTDNFVGKNMYGDLKKAYFRPEIAKMIVKAQKLLKAKNKDYSLVIYDATRPLSVQKKMYDLVKDTPNRVYVAKPNRGGGHHNYGCAVDLSITYKGVPVDMGTGFDSFSPLSHITNEKELVRQGKLSKQAYQNRLLLRTIMRQVGFDTYRREWWHFNHYQIKYVRAHFKSLDF